MKFLLLSAALLLTIFTPSISAQQTVTILFVQNGQGHDAEAREALAWTTNSLNSSGGTAAGFNYTFAYVNTFSDAEAYIATHTATYIQVVAKGRYNQDGYTNEVWEFDNFMPELDAQKIIPNNPIMQCRDVKISNDDVGAFLAKKFRHRYRKSDGTVVDPQATSSSSTPPSGVPTGSSLPPGGTWTLQTMQYQVGYNAIRDGQWIYVTEFMTVSYWSYEPPPGGFDQMMAYHRERMKRGPFHLSFRSPTRDVS